MFGTPKTSRSRRTVLLLAGTAAKLREHCVRQRAERLKVGPEWAGEDLVFCTETGRPLDPGTVNHRLRVQLAAAGLPPLRPHDFRHTAATYLLTLGVHPSIVQDMLGHSSITLTLNTYSHVVPALHERATAHMNALFADPKGA